MITTQCDKLLTNGAATIGFSLATFCVLNNSFHLLAGRQRAVCVSALAGMDKGLDAALDAKTSALLRALGSLATLTVAVVVDTQAPFDHLVLMALGIVAVNA